MAGWALADFDRKVAKSGLVSHIHSLAGAAVLGAGYALQAATRFETAVNVKTACPCLTVPYALLLAADELIQ
jgi:hypothetical protein